MKGKRDAVITSHYSRIHYIEGRYSTREKGRTKARTDYTAPDPTARMGRVTFRGEEELLLPFLVLLFAPTGIGTQRGNRECLYIRSLFFPCTFHGPMGRKQGHGRKARSVKRPIRGMKGPKDLNKGSRPERVQGTRSTKDLAPQTPRSTKGSKRPKVGRPYDPGGVGYTT